MIFCCSFYVSRSDSRVSCDSVLFEYRIKLNASASRADSMFVFRLLALICLTVSSFGKTKVCFDNISNSSTAVTALILARGGSKGIHLKNIQKIDGVSLLGISLTALQRAKRFETIWVSTDHQQIADEASRCWLFKSETSWSWFLCFYHHQTG